MNKRRIWTYLIALGLAHGIFDALSGYQVISYAHTSSWIRLGTAILVFNVIAFALQPFFGWMVDVSRRPEVAVILALVLAGLSLPIFLISSVAGLIVLAIGSALFHVAGGVQSSLLVPNSSMGSSIFNAPGVMGLALGTYAALQSMALVPVFGVLFLMVACILLATQLSATERQPLVHPSNSLLSRFAVGGLIFLIVAAAARSTVWMQLGKAVALNANWILLFGGMAALGKLCGGFMADRIGMKQVMVGMTLLAALCFTQTTLPALLIGTIFLQASTPVALAFLVQRIPRWGATMTGLILGSAIALGGFIANQMTFQYSLVLSMGLIASAISFWVATACFPLVRRNS